MKYLLVIRPDVEFDGPVPAEIVAATEAWVAEMRARGVRLHGDALRPVRTTYAAPSDHRPSAAPGLGSRRTASNP